MDSHPRSEERTADPEDERKPDSPTDLDTPSWRFALKRTLREFSDDQCTDLAAALTYYAVLSLFPALIAIISILSLFGGTGAIDGIVQIVEDLGQPDAAQTVGDTLATLQESQAAGFGLVIGLAGALWSASGYVGAFGRAMNRMYEVGEGRPFWKLRPLQIVITLVAVLLISVVAVLLVVSGPLAESLGSVLGLGSGVVTAWQIVKWPVLVGVAVLIIAFLYYATPNVQQPKFRWISAGAIIALVVWAVASLVFAFYVANFGSYNKTYGALGGVVVFLLWLWITNLSLLFGAEFDSEMERSRQLQGGIAAEDELQLPARDTTTLEKKEKTEAEDRAEARRIREAHDDEESEQPTSHR